MPRGRPRNTAAGVPAVARRRANNRPVVPFAYKLVLHQWLLSLFNVKRFEDLAEHLRNETLEGLDENNVHHFHHALTAQFFNLKELPTELLLEYDQAIVKHTQRLNERRITRGEEPFVWKYFQYLTLLFTEIYLDRYFRDPQALLTALNAQVMAYNVDKPEADQIVPFDEQAEAWPQLNKLAYWSATGSGKTLLMHANILQYQHYLTQHGRRRELSRIILLTPNEGLSQQHLRDFETAGMAAELFNKDGRGLFAGRAVEILDIHKLKDEMGDKTVAIDAFEGNNLVLVDEGHRGASGGEEGTWMRFRNALCEKGFSFEYSATFGQAVKGNKALTDLYAKSVLFDYSYRYFYGDGFGKDYQILNLDEGTQQNHLELYLVACLLSFFQQQRLYREQEMAFRPFHIDKPLWIFVGGKVTATLATKDASDIIEILRFLARYVSDRTGSIQRIERVLNQGLITADGKNLFAGRFTYLNTVGLSAAQVFDETLAMLFNAAGGGSLYVENLKGATGEVALRVGDNEPFGVINVGDDKKLCDLCDARDANGQAKFPELTVSEREFSGSLFHEINKPDSTVNLLIGSKKFTEGWNSWRVSTMALMNVGATEGSQIIQLFGRGVRLKGYDLSLKRSSKTQIPGGRDAAQAHRCAGDAWHLRYPRRLHGAVPRLPQRGRAAHQRRPNRVTAAGDQESGHAEAQDHPPPEDHQRREHRVRRRLPQTRASADARQAGTEPRSEHTLPSEEPGCAQLVPEDSGDEVGRLGGRRCDGCALSDPPDSKARRLPRLRPTLLRAGAVQGRARLAQPEPGEGRHRDTPCRSELVPTADPPRGTGVRLVREGAAVGRDCAGAAQEVHRALLHLPQA